jgi:hypothetical protein
MSLRRGLQDDKLCSTEEQGRKTVRISPISLPCFSMTNQLEQEFDSLREPTKTASGASHP